MFQDYEEDILTRDQARQLVPGDKVMFIDFREPERRDSIGRSLHNRVCTVKHIDRSSGAIECEESPGSHLILKCWHKLIERPLEVDDDAFNAVFV